MSKNKTNNIIQSLKHAQRGILEALKKERNFKIEIIITFIVLVAAVLLKFTPAEMSILTLTIGFVLFAELINTSIEFVLDTYYKDEYSFLVRISKDISAAAVLVSVIVSIVVGILLFIPNIMKVFLRMSI